MGKNKHEGGERPIIIKTGDEAPEPNSTFLALLRDGEKVKPGDPRGTLADRLGGEVQGFMAEQMRVAKHRRTAVKGSVTLTISTVTGADGLFTYSVDSKVKTAKVPPGTTMTFVDDDGELTSRPVEPLTEKMYERERAAKDTNPAEPKVGGASPL